MTATHKQPEACQRGQYGYDGIRNWAVQRTGQQKEAPNNDLQWLQRKEVKK